MHEFRNLVAMKNQTSMEQAYQLLTSLSWVGEDLAKQTQFLSSDYDGAHERYLIELLGRRWQLRLPLEQAAYEGYFVEESHNHKLASLARLTGDVIYFDDQLGGYLTEHIEGEELTGSRCREPAILTQIGQLYDRLHGGPKFLYRHNPIGRFAQVVEQLAPLDPSLRDPLLGLYPEIERLIKAFAPTSSRFRPCHNDPYPHRFCRAPQQLYLLGWQMSGQSDPQIEMGGFCNHAGLQASDEELLNQAYQGRPKELWRMRLGRVFSSFHYGLRAARDCLQPSRVERSSPKLMARVAELNILLARPETEEAASALAEAAK